MGKENGINKLSSTSPICKSRVTYLGSAVPRSSKDGLQGIQEPLKDLYPDETTTITPGIDSWLSVWSNGILMENIDESGHELKRFFPIESLHYCAAVKYVVFPTGKAVANDDNERSVKFLPLDSPFSKNSDAKHPPVFACILRRTSGIKVLECHAFLCKRAPSANSLVRSCFHAFADAMYAKQTDDRSQSLLSNEKSHSITDLNSVQKELDWRSCSTETLQNTSGSPSDNNDRNENSRSSSEIEEPRQLNNHLRCKVPLKHERKFENQNVPRSIRSNRANYLSSISRRQNIPHQFVVPMNLCPPYPLIPFPMLPDHDNGKYSIKKMKSKHIQNGRVHKNGQIHPYIGNGYPINLVPTLNHPSSYIRPSYSLKKSNKNSKPILYEIVDDHGYYSPEMPINLQHPNHVKQPQRSPVIVDPSVEDPGTMKKKNEKSKSKQTKKQEKESELPVKKKGHEKASSHSQRQQHRSRSNSLVALNSSGSDGEKYDKPDERVVNASVRRNGKNAERQVSEDFENMNLNEGNRRDGVANGKRSDGLSGPPASSGNGPVDKSTKKSSKPSSKPNHK